MVREYSECRKVTVEGLKKIKGLTVANPRGAFYVFPEISGLGVSEIELTKYLIESARVVVSPGYPFFGPDGRNCIRIAYTVSIPRIEEALKRLQSSIEKLPYHIG